MGAIAPHILLPSPMWIMKDCQRRCYLGSQGREDGEEMWPWYNLQALVVCQERKKLFEFCRVGNNEVASCRKV